MSSGGGSEEIIGRSWRICRKRVDEIDQGRIEQKLKELTETIGKISRHDLDEVEQQLATLNSKVDDLGGEGLSGVKRSIEEDGDQSVGEHKGTIAAQATEVLKAQEAVVGRGVEEVLVALKGNREVILTRLDKVDEMVDNNTKNIEALKNLIDSLIPSLNGIRFRDTVLRQVIVPGEATQTVYLVTGFARGVSALTRDQHEWLREFGEILRSCGEDGPKVRLDGLASSEDYLRRTPASQELARLCEAPVGLGIEDVSDQNNCVLANDRAAEAATVLAAALDDGADGGSGQRDDAAVAQTLRKMNSHCANSASGSSLPLSQSISVRPLCKFYELDSRRHDVDPDLYPDQPHFLNRSVRILIRGGEECPGF